MCDLRRLADLEPTLRANGRKDLEKLLKKHLASTMLAPSSLAADDGGGTLGMCVERTNRVCATRPAANEREPTARLAPRAAHEYPSHSTSSFLSSL